MTHQIKISERESEAFPLSSWGCSLQRTPPLRAPPALLRPRAVCDQPRSLPSQSTACLCVLWEPEGVEETALWKLRSRWSRRFYSGGGPRAASALCGIPELKPDVWISVRLAWRPWLGNRESPHPQPGRAARRFPTSGAQGRPERCPGRGCSLSKGEASPCLTRPEAPRDPLHLPERHRLR